MKKIIVLILIFLLVGLISGWLRTQASANISWLDIDYGETTVTKPLDHFAKHKFKIKNTSSGSQMVAFSIFIGDSQNSQVGWPQPQTVYLEAGEEKYVQTFLESAKLSIEQSAYGLQEKTLRWEWSDSDSGQKRVDNITYKINVLKNEEVKGDYSLRGKVVDSNNKVVSGYEVLLSTGTSGWMTSAKSADDGSFSFSNIPWNNQYFLKARSGSEGSGAKQLTPQQGSGQDSSTVNSDKNPPANQSDKSPINQSTDQLNNQSGQLAPAGGNQQNGTLKPPCDPPPAPCDNGNGAAPPPPGQEQVKGATTESSQGVAYAKVEQNKNDYTLKLTAPQVSTSNEIFKEEKTDIGFWKGAVDKEEKSILLVNGMENWSNADLKSQSQLYLYDFEGNKKWSYDMGHEAWGADLSADGKYAAFTTSSQTKNFGVLNAQDGQPLWIKSSEDFREPEGMKIDSKEVRISPDNQYLAMGASGGNVYLLKLASGEKIWNQNLKGQVRAISFAKNNDYLYAASGDGNAYKLKISDGSIVWKQDIGSWAFGDQAFKLSYDEKYLGSASKAGEVTVIKTENGQKVWQDDQVGATTWMDLSPDAKYMIAGGGGQGATTLYELESGKKLWRLEEFSHQGKFSADSKFIIIGDKNLRIIDLAGNEVGNVTSQTTNDVGQGQFAYINRDASRIIYTRRDIGADTVSIIFAKGSAKVLANDSQNGEASLASQAQETISNITNKISNKSANKWLLYGLPILALLIIGAIIFFIIKKRKIKSQMEKLE